MNMKRTHVKIISNLNSLLELTTAIRCELNKKLVFTNGCFDILHAGHIHLLEKAKNTGDFLLVAINSDKSIQKIKGDKRPIVSQENRALVIAALQCVDFVYIFDEETPYKLIYMVKPDILIKGRDWDIKNIVGVDIVTASGGTVSKIPTEIDISTSQIIEKILNAYKEKE